MRWTIKHDDISPAISGLLATAKNPRPLLRAMGTTFKSITEGTFNSVGAEFRPEPWKPKFDGSASNLQKSTTLAKSFHLEIGDHYATLSNPTIYAAVHQYGAVIRAKGRALVFRDAGGNLVFRKQVTIPARPFFPIVNGKLTPAAERLILRAGMRVLQKQHGVKGGSE